MLNNSNHNAITKKRRVHVTTSPFLSHAHPVTTYEKIKMYLFFPLLIVRLMTIFGLILIGTAIGVIAGWNRPADLPLSAARRQVLLLATWVARGVLLCLGFLWIPVEGYDNYRRAIREKGFLIVFNHISTVDSPMMVYLFMPSFLAKSDVEKYPIIGPFLRCLDMLYVKRADVSNATSAGMSSMIAARATDKRFHSALALAPEGTCSDGRHLLEFRTGAFVAGVPVLPVLLSYPNKHNNVAWTMQDSRITLWRMLTQFVNYARVRVLPLYRPSAEEKANPELYRDNVRALMARELGVPLREETLEDSLELIKRGIHLPFEEDRVIIPEGAGVGPDGWLEYEMKTRKSAVDLPKVEAKKEE